MKQIDKTPFWVTLAYGNIHTRKMAMILVISCVVFALYCVPWVQFSNHTIVAKLFLIDDWSWVAIMIPTTIWYWVSLKWVDKNAGWIE
ncbi:MAG: hypothetical protein BVN34_04530 [Proteobacteria bacterium ST_bin12]|nr:MAG: hypothetical protein BVN34_04530 [Proteobacteria bacterium ST_bin12]